MGKLTSIAIELLEETILIYDQLEIRDSDKR